MLFHKTLSADDSATYLKSALDLYQKSTECYVLPPYVAMEHLLGGLVWVIYPQLFLIGHKILCDFIVKIVD